MTNKETPDWGEIEEPWFESEDFVKALIDKSSILDILDANNLEYTKCYAGNFDYSMKCPFSFHKRGNERTASLYVSTKTNSFSCFGCNSNGTIIDFIKFLKFKPYYEIIKEIAAITGAITDADISKIQHREPYDPKKTVEFYVFHTGVQIRDFVKNIEDPRKHYKWQKWANNKFKKLDNMLDNLPDEDWEKAKQYDNMIKEFLNNKKG